MENKLSIHIINIKNKIAPYAANFKNKLGTVSLAISILLLLFFVNQMAIYDFIYMIIPLGPNLFPVLIMTPITILSLLLFIGGFLLALISLLKNENKIYSAMSVTIFIIEAVYMLFFTKII